MSYDSITLSIGDSLFNLIPFLKTIQFPFLKAGFDAFSCGSTGSVCIELLVADRKKLKASQLGVFKTSLGISLQLDF